MNNLSKILYALSLFPENSAKTLPLLKVCLSKASIALEIVNIIFAIGTLADADILLEINLHSFLSHDSIMVRVFTAFILARDFRSQDVVDILANAIPFLDELAKQVCHNLWYFFQSIENYIGMIFSRAKIPDKDQIISELGQKLVLHDECSPTQREILAKKYIYAHLKYPNKSQVTFEF